jgi:hypothetical protein
MFIQVIQGQTTDADAIRAGLHRWIDELAPTAAGWLGCTAGVTPDGTCITLVRFESAEAARRTSERPEQGRWWAQMAQLYTGHITVHDATDVVIGFDGGSDDAGFVQVIEGRTGNAARMRQMNALPPTSPLRKLRPDMIGWILALHDGDRYTKSLYFTSEKAAREGEQREPSPEMKARLEEERSWLLSDTTFHDLPEPWLFSPK